MSSFTTPQLLSTSVSSSSPQVLSSTSNSSSSPQLLSSTSDSPKQLLTVASYNRANASAPTAASGLARGTGSKALPSKRPQPQADLTLAKCCRNACRKVFVIADNVDGICSYHPSPPVFGGNEKFWSCCPQNCYWEYDRFLTIPTCSVGIHKCEVEHYDEILFELEERALNGETDYMGYLKVKNVHAAMGYDGSTRVVADCTEIRTLEGNDRSYEKKNIKEEEVKDDESL